MILITGANGHPNSQTIDFLLKKESGWTQTRGAEIFYIKIYK